MAIIDVASDPTMSQYSFILGLKKKGKAEHYYDDLVNKIPSNLLL